MKYKTLFRLLLKFLGVWVTVNGINQALTMLGYAATYFVDRNRYGNITWQYLSSAMVSLLQIGIGVYLFTAPAWIVNRAIPTNRPYCPDCGYDLTGATRPVCNECGADISGILPDPGRS